MTKTATVAKPIRLQPSTPYQQPFDFTDLPLAVRLAQWSDERRIKLVQKLLRKFNQWQYRPDTPVYDMSMIYDHPKGQRQWSVRSANHQYRFAWLPRFRHQWKKEIFSLLALMVARRQPKVVYDIGANWGQHSLYLCSLPYFTGHIHAFEPIPATYDDLSHNITEAGLDGQITAHDVALSRESGVATMVIPKNIFSGRAHIVPDGKGYAVTKAQLDSLKLPMPDFIKLDVEGHELAVLEGAEATILKAKPAIILESLFIKDSEAMLAPLAFLEKRGAMLYTISADGDAVVLTPLFTLDRATMPVDINIFACFTPADAYFNG